MSTEIIGWIERPGFSGVVVKEHGELISLDFTKINQLLNKVDKSSWRQLCSKKGYLDDRSGKLHPGNHRQY